MSLISEIENLLTQVDEDFCPPISLRVGIPQYAEKIARDAAVFSAYDKGRMIAFIAIYCNELDSRVAFMTMVAVANQYRKSGLASSLIETGIRHIRRLGFNSFRLEVHKTNLNAVAMYKRLGFATVSESDQSLFMEMIIA